MAHSDLYSDLYPVMLDLTDVDVLVVGGGRVATNKARGLVDSGALVTVVAPVVSAELAEMAVLVRQREFEAADVVGKRLVFTATGDGEVDSRVFVAADEHGIWVNSADDPPRCSFILPAVLRDGPVVVSVSTTGHSPALASYLRDLIEALLPPGVGDVAVELAVQRRQFQSDGVSTETVDWRSRIEGLLVEHDGDTH